MKRRLSILAAVFALVAAYESAHLLIATGVRMMAPAVEELTRAHGQADNGWIDVTKPLAAALEAPPMPDRSVIAELLGPENAWAANFTVNVMDRGARGNGTTDDSAAFQAAATALASTGGVIWVPPNRKYRLDSTISIKSKYAVWMCSEMTGNMFLGGAANTNADKGCIIPGAAMDHMFEWDDPTGEDLESGGGGMRGLNIIDITTNAATYRTQELTAAVWVNCQQWRCLDCSFAYLDGSAIKFGTTNYSLLRGVKIYGCGNTGTSALDLDGNTANAFVWIDRCFLEGCNLDNSEAVIRINDGCFIDATSLYLESGTGGVFATPSECYIDATEGGGLHLNRGWFLGHATTALKLTSDGNHITQSKFNHGATAESILLVGDSNRINDNEVIGTSSQTGAAIKVTGDRNTIALNQLDSSGGIQVVGSYAKVSGNDISSTYSQQSGVILLDGSENAATDNTITTIAHATPVGIHCTNNGFRIVGNSVTGTTNANSIKCDGSAGVILGNRVDKPINANAANTEGFNHDAFATFGSFTFDPASVAAGATLTSSDFALSGAVLGKNVTWGSSVSVQGLIVTAYVSTAGNVRVNLFNPTGSAIDLASGTWYFRVHK